MEEYTIKKVLNNNVVVAEKDKKQFILVGKAIGFNSRKGSKISEDKIESIFVKQTEEENNFNKILESVDNKIVGISEEIISFCENELKAKFTEAIHVSLPDHINFAINRIKQGIKIENPFLHELMALYPKEYSLAKKAIDMINKRLDVNLPETEIGFICMHINAALNNKEVSSALSYTKKIGEVMELISKLLKKDFDKNSIEYLRTVTHINFMLQRVIKKKTIKNYLLDSIKKEMYNEYDLAIKIALKIENLFSIKIPEDEIGYIALHIRRLSEI
ncbi:transcriptional antiterminator, BglG family [Clostridium sp. USBA 49]|jgi:transcriptional antiterminator|uniref:PRD domain-containing protein n=1 Tax=Clostridium TaxID=1485 RepID=UPI0009999C2C|nr:MULTISPECIES: PRD domain-containing protein [Clostridium]SKA73375.1 transcriptional antiterminator, BglG family [Clostridium sp. USBA 49]